MNASFTLTNCAFLLLSGLLWSGLLVPAHPADELSADKLPADELPVSQPPAHSPTTSVEADWASGAWEGTLTIPGGELRFHIELTHENGTWSGTVDVPQQGVHSLALQEVVVDGGKVTFRLPGGAGDPRYEGSFENGEIQGTFHQGGASLPLTFQQTSQRTGQQTSQRTSQRTDQVGSAKAPAPPAQPARPQTPEPPYPYRVHELTYGHDSAEGPVTLAATLTLPDVETHGKGPYPAVLLLTGSGLQDRDETILGHKPFLVLADHLTRAGIAVLRADDRSVGGSKGPIENATLVDFADDAFAGLQSLVEQEEIDTRRIGILGHSEGGMVAPLAAQRFREETGHGIAFLILFASPAVPGDDLIVRQVELLNLAAGATPDMARQNAAFQRRLFDRMEQGGDEAELRQDLIDMLSPHLGPEGAKTQIEPLLSPWYRHFVSYDPAPALRKIQAPVLALNGSLDMQVDAEQNLSAIRTALEAGGNENVTIYTSHGHNHLFQPAKTGSVNEYAEIETTIAPEVLDVITHWMLGKVAPSSSTDDG